MGVPHATNLFCSESHNNRVSLGTGTVESELFELVSEIIPSNVNRYVHLGMTLHVSLEMNTSNLDAFKNIKTKRV